MLQWKHENQQNWNIPSVICEASSLQNCEKRETAELQMNGLDRFLLICSDKTMSEKSNLPLQVLLRPENRNKTLHKYMKSNQNEGS